MACERRRCRWDSVPACVPGPAWRGRGRRVAPWCPRSLCCIFFLPFSYFHSLFFLSPLVRCVSAVVTTPGLFLLFFWAWGKLDSQPLAFWRLLRGTAQTAWSRVWWQVGCLWAVATLVDRDGAVSPEAANPEPSVGSGLPGPAPGKGLILAV